MKQYCVNEHRALREMTRKLYWKAFPRAECVPWWLLRLLARKPGVDLTAWVEDGEFCAMTASVTTDELHYLWYFAVAEEKRGQGVGSRILETLQAQHTQLTLNIEPVVPTAPNYPERQRRLAFYRRNGLEDTGWDVWEVGGQYRILATALPLDPMAFKKIFKKLSFGIWDVKLKEAN